MRLLTLMLIVNGAMACGGDGFHPAVSKWQLYKIRMADVEILEVMERDHPLVSNAYRVRDLEGVELVAIVGSDPSWGYLLTVPGMWEDIDISPGQVQVYHPYCVHHCLNLSDIFLAEASPDFRLIGKVSDCPLMIGMTDEEADALMAELQAESPFPPGICPPDWTSGTCQGGECWHHERTDVNCTREGGCVFFR